MWMTFRSHYTQASRRDEEKEWVEDLWLNAVWFGPRVERDACVDVVKNHDKDKWIS